MNAFVAKYYQSKLDELKLFGIADSRKESNPIKAKIINEDEILRNMGNLIGLPRGPNMGQVEIEKFQKNKRGLSSQNNPNADSQNFHKGAKMTKLSRHR